MTITTEPAVQATGMTEVSETSAASSILLVHGRDFKPPEEQLRDLNFKALRIGIERDYPDQVDTFERLGCHLAYYGDLTSELLESKGKSYDPVLDFGDRCNALSALSKIPARKRFGIRQYDCLPGKSAFPEFLADVGAPFLGTIGLTMPLISLVSSDFHAYLGSDTRYADHVRERVRSKLCDLLDKSNRVLLVSHGTGCAVAYDVLWQLSHDDRYSSRYREHKVDTWLTLGAPLGDYHIRKRLLGRKSGAAAQFPANVISWHNVSAEDDYTCHDNTLADDFKRMMKEHLVSAVDDYRIYNLAVRYGKSNPHSSVGYFIHPRVAKIVTDWIRVAEPDISPKHNY